MNAEILLPTIRLVAWHHLSSFTLCLFLMPIPWVLSSFLLSLLLAIKSPMMIRGSCCLHCAFACSRSTWNFSVSLSLLVDFGAYITMKLRSYGFPAVFGKKQLWQSFPFLGPAQSPLLSGVVHLLNGIVQIFLMKSFLCLAICLHSCLEFEISFFSFLINVVLCSLL